MTYVVQSGDTMYTIAQQHGCSLQDLIAANPQVKDPNLIYPGQTLTIPTGPSPSPYPGPAPGPYPGPAPGTPMGWCTMMLMSQHPKCQHGVALIQKDAHLLVAADLPDPGMWSDCECYTAWLMSRDPAVLLWFDLLPLKGTGFWINHHQRSMTIPADADLVVTAEKKGHRNTPCGMKVLHGSMRNCCRSDS